MEIEESKNSNRPILESNVLNTIQNEVYNKKEMFYESYNLFSENNPLNYKAILHALFGIYEIKNDSFDNFREINMDEKAFKNNEMPNNLEENIDLNKINEENQEIINNSFGINKSYTISFFNSDSNIDLSMTEDIKYTTISTIEPLKTEIKYSSKEETKISFDDLYISDTNDEFYNRILFRKTTTY